MFYTRAFFRKIKALRFDLPPKVDEEFYLDIKHRQANSPEVKFQSEVSLWQLYKIPLIIFMLTIFSILVTAIFLFISPKNPNFAFYIFLFIFIICLRPSMFSGLLLWHYFKYVRAEKKFHTDFNQSVAQSVSFSDFESRFYTGRYSETMELKGWLLHAPFQPVKEFAETTNLQKHLTIYKYAKGENYILLSDSVELIAFIEKQAVIVSIPHNDRVMQIVKKQLEFPFVLGNKRLKHLID